MHHNTDHHMEYGRDVPSSEYRDKINLAINSDYNDVKSAQSHESVKDTTDLY